MPTYSITGPDGKEYSIDGPEGATQDQVVAAIQEQLALKNKPIETAGPIEAAIGSTKRMASSALTGIQLPFGADEAAMQGISRQKDITEKPAGSLEAVKQAYEQRGFLPAAKEVVTQVPGVIAEQFPLIGSMAAGARVGAMAGPWGALAGSILGPLISYAGSSAERKAEEQIAKGENVDVGAAGAFASGAGQAALDRLSLGLSGLSRVFGISAKELGTEAAEKLAKESLGMAIAKGTIKTELSEIPTEIAQQAIERYYAGLSLTGEDALKEYGDIAYQTSLMGPLGGIGRVSERSEQQGIIKGQEQRQQRELGRIDAERARIDQIALDAKLENINAERDRINKIAEDAKTEAEIIKAKEAADALYQSTINTLGNKAPEKSRLAKSIATMQKDFDAAIEQGDINAQKKAIAELTDVPTNIISLAQKYETKPTDVITDQTFKSLKVGPTAKVIEVLKGKDPLNPEDNQFIRNTWEQFLKNKEDDAPQSIAIRNYLNEIPTVEGLQDETAVVRGPREGVQVPGQPVAGGLTAGIEGVDGTGLGGTTDNVQQLAGREGPRPAPLAPESTEVLPSANEMIKNYEGDTLFQFLNKKGGIKYSNIAELTNEKKIPNRRGAFSLFRREGGNDIIEMIESGELDKYLPYDAKLQGGSQEFSGQPFDIEPAIDYIQKAFINNEDIRDYEFETELANVKNQEREFESQASIPTEEELNKDVQEIAAETKGRDVLFAEPKQQLGERSSIFDKVTNAKELFKAVMKIANTRSDKTIINMLEKVPNLETVKFTTVNNSTNPELQGAAGYFDPNTNTIFVDPRVTDLSHITLHEILHAATDAEFDKHVKVENNRHTALTPLGKKAVKLFDSFMDASLKRQEGFYGQKNIKEFFMEANTDPKLKQFLQNQKGVLDLKPAKGKVQTLWSDFVNLIKSMFGIPEYAHSMLDEILLLSPEFMKGPGAVTTGKEVSQARITPEGMTRPDGTPLKYIEDTNEGIIQKFKNVFNDDTNQWRKWMDQLGNRIVGGRYSVERKALDADLPAVDAFREGRIRGDLINLQAYNSMSLAQAGLYLGRLILRKSGLIIAGDSSGPDKVKMLDISKGWNELVDKATQDLGSKELAYDMLVAGYYGPRYAELAEFNKTASSDEKINIDEWTESDKKTADEAYRRYGTELKRLQDMRNVQRKDLLDFMVDAGLYTREKADRFLSRAEYVALYRVPEEDIESFDRPTTKGAGLLGAGKEYRLVGSKRAAADPIDNYIANMSWMMQRGIKNNAAKHTADMMQQLGIGQWYDRPMTDVEKKAYHHITVHVDGLPKDFRVMDPNDMAAFSASPIISGAIWDIMKYPVSALRHGITMMPQFVWNQAWEDPIRATFTSGNRAGFLSNISKTWKSIANNQFKADRTPNAAMLNRYGIVGQKDVLDSADIINLYKGKDKKLWEKSLFFFERMAQGSDLGAREAIYENATKELEAEGYDRETAEDLAAVRSHQYMPYQQMGMSRSLAYLRRMMPFVNPPIQGMARDIAAARGRISGISKAEGKKLLTFRLAKYLMFTAMYAAFMSGDDEYENQSEEQQDNNFFIGGLRMPVPQELRPLKVAAERGTRAWVLNAPKADIEDMDVAAAALRKTWELVAGFAPIPSAVRPLAENYTNFDIFSGLPVVSAGQQRKEPYLQYTEKTSEIAKLVGAQLNYSPIKIDKLLKGYFGYLGQTLGQVSNYFAGDRPAPTANDIIFVGSMLENQRATGNRGDFYDLYDKVVTAKASANALLQEGKVDEYRDYMNKNKGYVAIEKSINNLHNQLTKLRDYKRIIIASNRTAEEKREALDRLNESENNMLNNIKDLNRRAVEINKQD
jgi:acetolactate synthase regulatory subunit